MFTDNFWCMISLCCRYTGGYHHGKNKHLFLAERIAIKSMFDQSASFKAIDRAPELDCATISKEVRGHSSYEVFRMFYGQEILDILGTHLIFPNDITLRPEPTVLPPSRIRLREPYVADGVFSGFSVIIFSENIDFLCGFRIFVANL